MKSDRLIVLVAPEEKARIVALARARQTSVGELVRSALSDLDDGAPARAEAAGQARTAAKERANGEHERAELSTEQAAALERLADVALKTMRRANAALDQAFEEIAATKAHFAAKRRRKGASA